VKISERWQKVKLKHLVQMNPGKSEISYLSDDTLVSFIPMSDVKSTRHITTHEVKQISTVYSGYTYFRNGDLLIAKITPCFENGKGAVAKGLKNNIGFGTTEFHVVRPGKNLSVEFIDYLTCSYPFMTLGAAAMTGSAGQQRVPESFIGDYEFGLPPLETQRRIATYLDRKTQAIDALIAKKQRMIELLEEKRSALINHVVTKGLNPDVPMKDSGIPWIGEVPAHWNMVPSKWLFVNSKTKAKQGDDQLSATQSYGVIKQKDFERMEGRRVVKIFQHLEQRKHVDVDDFVISMRSFQGGLERAWVPGCIRSSYVVLKPKLFICTDYFSYLFKSESYIQALNSTSNYIRDGQDLNFKNFAQIKLPSIPLEEQGNIASKLKPEIEKIDSLIVKLKEFDTKLSEYRQALITAAVTGKIDVGDDPVSDDPEEASAQMSLL
jgi:type I restriction enzyme S subunit